MDHITKQSGSSQGLNLASFLHLSPEQRQLINWMRRQQTVDLSEIQAKWQHFAEKVELILEDLIKQGIVEIAINGDNPTYRIRLGDRPKKSKLQQFGQKSD